MIYGRNLKETILIQIPLIDANRFLKEVSRGGLLTIDIGEEKYNVLFKEVTREPVSQQVEHLEFHHIVANETVNSVANVVLINREKNENLIQQHIEEITYNALPRHFVQKVVIDLEGMNAGSSVKLEDLDIAKNEDIRLTMPEDTIILTIAEKIKAAPEEEQEDEQGQVQVQGQDS